MPAAAAVALAGKRGARAGEGMVGGDAGEGEEEEGERQM